VITNEGLKMIEKTRYLRRNAASEYLMETWGISRTPKTLAKLATIGGGPKFCRDGRIPLHTEEWLDEWVREQLSATISSTAELAVTQKENRYE
jgi:hypothetical protein